MRKLVGLSLFFSTLAFAAPPTPSVGFLTADGLCESSPCKGWRAGSFVYDAMAARLPEAKRFNTVEQLAELDGVSTVVLPYIARDKGKTIPAAVTDALYRFLADGGTVVAFGFTDPQWLIQVIRFRLEFPVVNTQAESRRTRMGAVEFPTFPEKLLAGVAVGYRTFDRTRVKELYRTVNDPGPSHVESAAVLTARVQRGRFVHFGLSETVDRLGDRATLLRALF